MESFLFYFFSAAALLSASFVIFLPKPTRALLSLIVTMFSLSILYLLLGAPFVAMVNLIVYAGAVLVLFLFVIMLQGIGATDIPLSQRFLKGYYPLVCVSMASFIFVVFLCLKGHVLWTPLGIEGTVEKIGRALFRDYLLPFELTSLLLLIGVFAAIALAKKPASPAGGDEA